MKNFYGLKIKDERLSEASLLHSIKVSVTPPQTKKSARITRTLPNLRVFDVNINTTERSDPLHSSGREGT